MGLIRIIRNSLSKVLCMLLALHFLNLSIDSLDPSPDHIPEDLSVNDIESVVEFLAEVVFGLDNVFAEHDEPDHHGRSTHYSTLFLVHPGISPNTSLNLLCAYTFYLKNTSEIEAYSIDISSPPPKA